MRKFNFGGNNPGRKPLFPRNTGGSGQSQGRPIFGFGKKKSYQSRPRFVAPPQDPIDVTPIDPIRVVSPMSPTYSPSPLLPVDQVIPGQHEGIVMDKEADPKDETPFYKKPAVIIGGVLLLGGFLFLATRKNSKK